MRLLEVVCFCFSYFCLIIKTPGAFIPKSSPMSFGALQIACSVEERSLEMVQLLLRETDAGSDISDFYESYSDRLSPSLRSSSLSPVSVALTSSNFESALLLICEHGAWDGPSLANAFRDLKNHNEKYYQIGRLESLCSIKLAEHFSFVVFLNGALIPCSRKRPCRSLDMGIETSNVHFKLIAQFVGAAVGRSFSSLKRSYEIICTIKAIESKKAQSEKSYDTITMDDSEDEAQWESDIDEGYSDDDSFGTQ